MTYDEYIPMYIKVLEARRTREVVTAQEWNNNFNLLIQQGDHTAEYLFELNKYLFVDDNGALPELITRAAATQEQLDIHENRFDNPHNVTAIQTTTEAIPSVAGGNVQDVLADLKKQIDTKADDADAESKYEKKTDAARHIVDADCDDNTGIFTFYRADGSTFAFPTNLSKVVNNWAFDPITQKMILTLEDGTTQEVDLSAFITAFEFLDSDTIKFDIVGKNVSASIAPDYLTAVTDQADRATSAATTSVSSAANATNSANAAASSATLAGTRAQEATTQASNAASYASMASSAKVSAQTAETNARAEAVTAKSYSEGGTGTRTGEDTDNSKYYSELSKSYAQQAAAGQVNSDWNETDPSSKAYILNKPTVEQTVRQSTNAVSSKAVDDALTSVKTTLNQSITTLAGRVTQTETDINNLTDVVRTNELAYLGWSVPYEMPIQNYVDANRVFHQRVGRVDLGTLNWELATTATSGKYRYYSTLNGAKHPASTSEIANTYCTKYVSKSNSDTYSEREGVSIHPSRDQVLIYDSNYATGNENAFKESLKGVYLYYELATEITFSADGNEKITSFEKHFEVNNFSVPHENLNLIPYPYAQTTKTSDGITFTDVGDGSININGHATKETYFQPSIRTSNFFVLPNGTYTVEASGLETGKTNIQIISTLNGAYHTLAGVSETNSKITFTVSSATSDNNRIGVSIVVVNGATVNNANVRFAIVKGTEIPNCLGWLNSSALVGKALGKNLYNPIFDTVTTNGVTCEALGNGTYRLNGTATADALFLISNGYKISLNANTRYKLVGCPVGGDNTTYHMVVQNSDYSLGAYDTGNGVEFTNVNSDILVQIFIRVRNGKNVSNLVFKPMLTTDLNATYDDFEKWQGLTSADATKYTKYAKIETDKYGADFIPQYVEPVPNAAIFTTAEKRALYKLGSEIVFGDDGFYVFAKGVPEADINLRIGGVC